MKKTNKERFGCLAVILLLILSVPWAAYAGEKPVKNVIFLMTDGTSAAHIALARWYKGGPLALDGILTGAVRTYSAESVITDSAPAATAFATGFKSNSKFVGVLPATTSVPGVAVVADSMKYRPLATVLEGARLAGKAVGLVATANIQHASPAAFSAHTPDRNDYNLIAKQQVYNSIDVVLGGGRQYLLPVEAGGRRTDGQDLTAVLRDRGYAVVATGPEMQEVKEGKLWGLFAADDMQYDMDRQLIAPHEPSLADMTRKAIEILSQQDKGFFLFVEASKVDWASHANEPMGVVSDLLAYDEAVGAALEFARRDGQTLIIACADHGNGGMTIGSKEVYSFYEKVPYERLMEPLKKARLTGAGVASLLMGDRSEEAVRQIMETYYGLSDLTVAEVTAIQETRKASALMTVIGHMLSARSAIGWVYAGHSGEDVFLYSYGPAKLTGLVENTYIATASARVLGVDLAALHRDLYVPASEAFAPLGATLALTDEPGRRVLIVTKGSMTLELLLDTDLLLTNGGIHRLPGVTVYIPQNQTVYVARAAVDMAKAAGF